MARHDSGALREDGKGQPLAKEPESFDVEGPRSVGPQVASTRLFVAVAACCMSPVLYGFSLCFTAPAQQTMTSLDTAGRLGVLTDTEFAAYAAFFNIGGVIGAFAGAPISDRIGRRRAIALTSVPHVACWFGHLFAASSLSLTVLRTIGGFGVGMGSAVVPVYIGEVSTSELRGILGAANQLSVTIGIFVVNVIGSYAARTKPNDAGLSFCNWRALALFAMSLAVFLLVMAFMPESPKWLAQMGRKNEARASLKILREGDSRVEAEALIAESESVKKAASSPGNKGGAIKQYWKSHIIGIGLQLNMQFSGCNAIMMFTQKICAEAGMGDGSVATMFAMGLQVLVTAFACSIMESYDRRDLLKFGCILCTLSHLGMGFYYHAAGSAPHWLALASLLVFIFGFGIAVAPIPFLMIAELFPTEAVGVASSIAIGLNWVCSFIVTLTFESLKEPLTEAGRSLLFATVCFLGALFVVFVVPETRGKSVTEVLTELRGGVRADVRINIVRA